MPQIFRDPQSLCTEILRVTGSRMVLAMPLGLGKANHIANEIFHAAVRDGTLDLKIFTALTLEKPRYANALEKRFLDPVITRLFGGYPELAYAEALRAHAMPSNIEVNEFFFLAGRWLTNPEAQQNYISANYTHAFRYVLDRGVNVIAQLVAKRGDRYSLSCNPDLTLDLLKARREGRANFLLLGQANSELPYMPGDAEIPAEEFHAILDAPAYDFPLFAPPKEPIDLHEYAAGFHVARLVPDGGTLQIGIGQEGDAAAHALVLRQRQNAAFCEAVRALAPDETAPAFLQTAPFREGLYAATEMLVDSFLALIDAGVLTREVDGALVHGAFFLGPKSFYRALREMPPERLDKIRMTSVAFTNQLYGDEGAKRAARKGARFVNSAMMATLLGAVVSDGLEDGRVVSGVGGQYNFVEQAFALPDARSVITLAATRTANGRTTSNIRWTYGHETIPRHLRDIIVTEYGVADLRGKADKDVIAAMLSIADSRFQDELMRAAKDTGKLPRSYEIPAAHRDNMPEKIERLLGPLCQRGLLPEFPFGTDFTPVEQRLMRALSLLKVSSKSQLAGYAFSGLFASSTPDSNAAVARMGFDRPHGISDRIYRLLLRAALAQTAEKSQSEKSP